MKTLTVIIAAFVIGLACLPTWAQVPNTFTAGQTARAADINENFNAADARANANAARSAALEDRTAALEARPTSQGSGAAFNPEDRLFVPVDCSADSEALITAVGSSRPYTTFEISGTCDGPILIVHDGTELVSANSDTATIVLPAGLDGTGNIIDSSDLYTLEVSGAQNVLLERIILDTSNYNDPSLTDRFPSGMLARNSFVLFRDSGTVGGHYGIFSFDNASVRFQGINSLTDWVVGGLSVGDVATATIEGEMTISTTNTENLFRNAIESYWHGNVIVRGSLDINLPLGTFNSWGFFAGNMGNIVVRGNVNDVSDGSFAQRNSTLDYSSGDSTYSGFFVRNDSSLSLAGTVNGQVSIDDDSFAQINSATINGTIMAQNASTITLGDSIVDGDFAVYAGSTLVVNNVTQTDSGSVRLSAGTVLEVRGSTLQAIGTGLNSSVNIAESNVGFITAFSATNIQLDNTVVAGVEIHLRTMLIVGDEISVTGDIALFSEAYLIIFSDTVNLNGNTIYLCGETDAINDTSRATGVVTDQCRPDN